MTAMPAGSTTFDKLLMTAAFIGAAALVGGTALMAAGLLGVSGVFTLGAWLAAGGSGVAIASGIAGIFALKNIRPTLLAGLWPESRAFKGSPNGNVYRLQ